MHRLSRGWSGHLLALLAGALVPTALAPFDLWPLGLLSVGALAWLLDELTPAQACWRSWCYGLGQFGAGTSWVYVSIHVYGYAPVPLAVFLTLLFSAGLALFTGAFGYVYARWLRDAPAGPTLGFAALFTLTDWWRSWMLTGFPWLYLGYGHLDSPLAGWAPLTGIFGLSFIVAFTAAVMARGAIERNIRAPAAAAVLVLWLGGLALNVVEWVRPADRAPVRVAMVQANIPQEVKWRREQYESTLRLYRQMSAALWRDNDIVIWPEAAIPGFYHNAEGFLDQLHRQALANSASLITGIPYRDTAGTGVHVYNSVMGFGDGSGIYHKQRLVPFGEYVPLETWLRGLIQFFDLPMSNFSRGPAGQQGIYADKLLLAPFVCYEIVYPDLVASWLPQADLLLTVSNDAWFGGSIGPLQHLQMAQMRALENGRYLLRSTGSGISAIVDQRGDIVVRGGQFSREIIRGEARAMQGETPFSRFGSGPILILCGLLCIGLPAFAAKIRR